jgi:hypothetical protein
LKRRSVVAYYDIPRNSAATRQFTDPDFLGSLQSPVIGLVVFRPAAVAQLGRVNGTVRLAPLADTVLHHGTIGPPGISGSLVRPLLMLY